MGVGALQHLGRHPGRFRFPRSQAFQTAAPTVPGVGSAGAATFVLSLEPDTRITYAWGTDIFKSYNGSEQRCNTTGPTPRQRFEGAAFLLDDQNRDVRGALQRAAAAGSTFLLALPYEEVTLIGDSTGTTVPVRSTASLDWALPGQRCVLIGTDATVLPVIVQSKTSSTITLGVSDAGGNLIAATTLGVAGLLGGRIMPLVQILLDPQQGFSRYPVNVGLWSIRAQAAIFGWAGTDSMGKDAQITTYTRGAPVDQSTLVENDLLIWDRPNLIEGTVSETMLSGAELVDMGAMPFGIGGNVVPDWARPIKYSSNSPVEWQWLKAFLRQVLGRQKAFALSTNRPDLIFVSSSAASMKVQSSTVVGGGDYVSWYVSQAHRRLAITKSDGTIQYVAVTAVTNNSDGTLTLALDQALVGSTVAMVSFLEQVRFDNSDSDNFPVSWDGAMFTVDLLARTTEETISPPGTLMYDAVIDSQLTYGFGVATPSDQEINITAGQVTYVRITSNRTSLTFGGISATGGNQDGMVVTLSGSSGLTLALNHEDTAFAAADRLWLTGRLSVSALEMSATFVYSSAVSRWILIWGGP